MGVNHLCPLKGICLVLCAAFLFFFNDTATTEIYTLSSHLGISYAVFCLKKKIQNFNEIRHFDCRINIETKRKEDENKCQRRRYDCVLFDTITIIEATYRIMRSMCGT